MTTKLVVSFDALSISNLNSVITARSIDEVIERFEKEKSNA